MMLDVVDYSQHMANDEEGTLRRMRSLQKFASVHSSVYNHFNQERSLTSRDTFKLTRAAALSEWRQLRSG